MTCDEPPFLPRRHDGCPAGQLPRDYSPPERAMAPVRLALLGAGIFAQDAYVPVLQELRDQLLPRFVWSRSQVRPTFGDPPLPPHSLSLHSCCTPIPPGAACHLPARGFAPEKYPERTCAAGLGRRRLLRSWWRGCGSGRRMWRPCGGKKASAASSRRGMCHAAQLCCPFRLRCARAAASPCWPRSPWPLPRAVLPVVAPGAARTAISCNAAALLLPHAAGAGSHGEAAAGGGEACAAG